MPPHEPPPDDNDFILKLILDEDSNDENTKETEDENLPPYQIVRVNMENNTVYIPKVLWDSEQ